MVDQVIGIGSVGMLIFLSVRLTQAFRDLSRSTQLVELERTVVAIPELEEQPTSAV